MARTSPDSRSIRFSIISAVYNVSRYLDEYIAAIEAQTFPLGRVQVIVVDDGSTDDSLARLEEWQRRRPELVTVLHKENGGQSSARNLGMERAVGEWVTFPDPDDVLESDYLTEIDKFIGAKPSVQMVAAKRVLFDEDSGQQRSHPLSMHFTTRNRLRNLDIDTAHFHGSAPCAFFRLDELRSQELRFDDRIKPSFEDGHFCCRYLLHVDTPWVGYVQSAIYLYRKRSDASSTLDLSWVDPRRYTDMVEFGFLALLREAADLRGRPPVWLQSMVLYELSWYFKVEDAVPWVSTAAHGEIGRRFNELLTQLLPYFERAVIEAYPERRLRAAYRDILLHGYHDEDWRTSHVVVDKIDMRQRTMRLSYRFTGTPPTPMFDVDGAEVRPLHSKIRTLRYFDRDAMYEQIFWLPFGTVRVLFDGVEADVRTAEPEQPTPRLDSWAMRKELDPVIKAQTAPAPTKLSAADRAVLRAADNKLVRRYFRRSWVLMDRVHNADDSAEHLFRHLRKKRRKTNAWFVIESGTPDHKRLRRDGLGGRVVAHGSTFWKLLMLNAEHLISTHIDQQVILPEEIVRLRDPRWRFTFLQHGVIKDDLSRWLNIKDLEVFVTSTRAEYDSIVEDRSPYKFTTREVQLTGLPRFDRLHEQGRKFTPDRRDLILIAPTWRNWLMGEATGEHRRNADVQRLKESDFIRNWWAVLTSDKLRALAEANGCKVALLMHPNMQSVVGDLDVPPHVEVLTFEGQDVQATFARAKVFSTDYSSMAFNAAYIDRPQVYFQFDFDRFFGGGHAGRAGYFDFERDGFGPVTYTADDTVDAIAAALTHGAVPERKYADRIAAAFPQRDGRCSERTVEAILNSVKRVKTEDFVVNPVEAPVTIEPANEPVADAGLLPAGEPVDD